MVVQAGMEEVRSGRSFHEEESRHHHPQQQRHNAGHMESLSTLSGASGQQLAHELHEQLSRLRAGRQRGELSSNESEVLRDKEAQLRHLQTHRPQPESQQDDDGAAVGGDVGGETPPSPRRQSMEASPTLSFDTATGQRYAPLLHERSNKEGPTTWRHSMAADGLPEESELEGKGDIERGGVAAGGFQGLDAQERRALKGELGTLEDMQAVAGEIGLLSDAVDSRGFPNLARRLRSGSTSLRDSIRWLSDELNKRAKARARSTSLFSFLV